MTTLNFMTEIVQQYIYHSILFYQLISIKSVTAYCTNTWLGHGQATEVPMLPDQLFASYELLT